jgi:hypothetical protein
MDRMSGDVPSFESSKSSLSIQPPSQPERSAGPISRPKDNANDMHSDLEGSYHRHNTDIPHSRHNDLRTSYSQQVDERQSNAIERVQQRMTTKAGVDKVQKIRRSKAGSLGPRIHTAHHIVKHNDAMANDVDQIGPPPDDDDDVIPNNSNWAYKPTQMHSRSLFARDVVQTLDVSNDVEAEAAMEVIDRISSITHEQLQRLDSATREQVLQLRRQLGIIDAPVRTAKETMISPTGSYMSNGIASRYGLREYDDDDEYSQLDNSF